MEAVGAYIMRLVCACLICGILQSVYPKGSTREILKILCGIFIAFTALSPVYQLDFSGFTSYFSEIRDVADAAAEDGPCPRGIFFNHKESNRNIYLGQSRAAESLS